MMVWRENRRDGGPGAARRRLLKPISNNGKGQAKVRWQYAEEKSDEPFHYVGTQAELKAAIAAAGGLLHIVEGEVDVWSLLTLGIANAIGIYGIGAIPADVASILHELGVSGFIYYLDNDKAGEKSAARLGTLLHDSRWKGEGEYRKVEGPGIPQKGDANDLLCHHRQDLSAARATLDKLPAFLPRIKREPVRTISPTGDHNQDGWSAVYEAVRIAVSVTHFKANGYSKKNISCPNPQHADKNPSAGWHKDGYCTCHGCGDTFNAKTVADWLGIPWRALIRQQLSLVSAKNIDLDAAPQQTEAVTAPRSFELPPDSWLRAFNKFFTQTDAVLFLFALRGRSAGLLPQAFTRLEFIKALPELGCNVSEGSIYRVFNDLSEHDNHPVFSKIDPSEESSSRHCKFRLRSLEEIRDRLLQSIRYRIYENKFRRHPDIVIDFEVFAQVLQGSNFEKTLESALKPLYAEQKQRFESLVRSYKGLIAG